jgi:hypothetical protein
MNTNINVEGGRNRNLSILYFVGIWIIYAISYYLLKNHSLHKEYAGFLSTAGDTTLNITMIFFSLWLWKNAVKEAKRPFGFFVLSFSFVIIPNALYQILFNVFHLNAPYFSMANTQLIMHHIMYAFCLIFEFAAWISIVAYIFSVHSKSKYKNYSLVAVVVGLVLASFLAVFMWKGSHAELSSSKYFEIYVTSFYVINFILATLCLAVCKSRGLFYLSLGYLVIIGADLVMAFGFMSQHLGTGSIFDTSWFLGLLLVLYGMLSFKKSGDYKFAPAYWLSSPNSIKTQSAVWSFVLCTVSLSVFLAADGFFNSTGFFFNSNLVRALPPSLIVYAIFTIAASNFFAKKFYLPLSRIERKVQAFVGGEGSGRVERNIDTKTKVSSEIVELQHLELFLQKSFQLVREKRVVEQDLIHVAAQAAHDICSPIMALDLALRKIPNMTTEQRDCVKNIEKSITNIARGLMHKYDAIKNKEKSVAILLAEAKECHIKNRNYEEEVLTPVLIANLIELEFEQKKCCSMSLK